MRMLWLTGAVASIALLAGCQTYPASASHGGRGPHDHAARADGPDGGGPAMHGPGMRATRGPGDMHAMMGGPDPAAMQARLDRAKAEIAITPAQEAAWTAYVAALNANRPPMAGRQPQPPQMAAGAHLPDRMRAHLAMMSAHLASMQQVQAAAQELYAALTEEQRTRADHALAMHGPRGDGPHGDGHESPMRH